MRLIACSTEARHKVINILMNRQSCIVRLINYRSDLYIIGSGYSVKIPPPPLPSIFCPLPEVYIIRDFEHSDALYVLHLFTRPTNFRHALKCNLGHLSQYSDNQMSRCMLSKLKGVWGSNVGEQEVTLMTQLFILFGSLYNERSPSPMFPDIIYPG